MEDSSLNLWSFLVPFYLGVPAPFQRKEGLLVPYTVPYAMSSVMSVGDSVGSRKKGVTAYFRNPLFYLVAGAGFNLRRLGYEES